MPGGRSEMSARTGPSSPVQRTATSNPQCPMLQHAHFCKSHSMQVQVISLRSILLPQHVLRCTVSQSRNSDSPMPRLAVSYADPPRDYAPDEVVPGNAGQL